MRKVEELRKLTKLELLEKKKVAVIEFKKVKFDVKSGSVTGGSVNKLRNLKLEISRISTILSEMNLVDNNEKESE